MICHVRSCQIAPIAHTKLVNIHVLGTTISPLRSPWALADASAVPQLGVPSFAIHWLSRQTLFRGDLHRPMTWPTESMDSYKYLHMLRNDGGTQILRPPDCTRHSLNERACARYRFEHEYDPEVMSAVDAVVGDIMGAVNLAWSTDSLELHFYADFDLYGFFEPIATAADGNCWLNAFIQSAESRGDGPFVIGRLRKALKIVAAANITACEQWIDAQTWDFYEDRPHVSEFTWKADKKNRTWNVGLGHVPAPKNKEQYLRYLITPCPRRRTRTTGVGPVDTQRRRRPT